MIQKEILVFRTRVTMMASVQCLVPTSSVLVRRDGKARNVKVRAIDLRLFLVGKLWGRKRKPQASEQNM